MKNQYFGDINDYMKYGLLRCFGAAGLRIGVCWMLTPDDGRTDGRKINYLSNPERWMAHDPILFDALAESLKYRTRHVRHAQKVELFPNVLFSNQVVPDKLSSRKAWLKKALAKLAESDLIFFDPDNGIEVASKPIGRAGSCKYLYWEEVELAWAKRTSLLIFQHFPRQNRETYILRLESELRDRVSGGTVVPLITSNVLYLLAYRRHHHVKVGLALDILAKRWVGHIWSVSLSNLSKLKSD